MCGTSGFSISRLIYNIKIMPGDCNAYVTQCAAAVIKVVSKLAKFSRLKAVSL